MEQPSKQGTASLAQMLSGRLRAIARHAEAGAASPYQRPGYGWWLARLLIASSKRHAFLDRAWISGLMRLVPARWQKPLALRLLSLSPHYWVYQWSPVYPTSIPRHEVLRREYERNLNSRQQLCDQLLKQWLDAGMTVLDFGCGPGFLAKAVKRHVARVVATDVSRGVIACACALNAEENLDYVVNGNTDLQPVATSSIDFVYSFAVFQHLRKEHALEFLKEFRRVLKPGGQGLIHTILGTSGLYEETGWVARRVKARMAFFSQDEILALVDQAGLQDARVASVSDLCAIDDDIGSEHVVLFHR
jgi:2-polyprenyl-3-methyl-5-hydroxy-6-metoxy-1,4-benzoquinol methylase